MQQHSIWLDCTFGCEWKAFGTCTLHVCNWIPVYPWRFTWGPLDCTVLCVTTTIFCSSSLIIYSWNISKASKLSLSGEVLTSVALISVFSYLTTSYHITLPTSHLWLRPAVWHCHVLWRGEGLIDAVGFYFKLNASPHLSIVRDRVLCIRGHVCQLIL